MQWEIEPANHFVVVQGDKIIRRFLVLSTSLSWGGGGEWISHSNSFHSSPIHSFHSKDIPRTFQTNKMLFFLFFTNKFSKCLLPATIRPEYSLTLILPFKWRLNIKMKGRSFILFIGLFTSLKRGFEKRLWKFWNLLFSPPPPSSFQETSIKLLKLFHLFGIRLDEIETAISDLVCCLSSEISSLRHFSCHLPFLLYYYLWGRVRLLKHQC